MRYATTRYIAAAVLAMAMGAIGLAEALGASILLVIAIGLPVLLYRFQLLRTRLMIPDVARIARTIERMSRRDFDWHRPARVSSKADPIDAAIQILAQQVRARMGTLEHAALHDPLTGMANRAHFQHLVETDLARIAANTISALIVADIDGFRHVNDTCGHRLGDAVLQCLADQVTSALRRDEAVSSLTIAPRIARIGGDQFAIFLPELSSPELAHRISRLILDAVAKPTAAEMHPASLTASVGMAFVPDDARDYFRCLRAAETAMSHAKRAGGNRSAQYSAQLDLDMHYQSALERDLRGALARGEFELHYQPQYDCRTLRIVSAEALIRWHHPRRGLVSPAEFIPIAEKSHLICDIGDWVVQEATQMIARFEQLGIPLRVSVNVSPQQLEQPDFVGMVKDALARSKATPRLLEIEVTEGRAMRCDMATERLNRLAEQGISIAIDDFGTGYSNLACLIRLPVSRLKIDRSLLQDITTRAEVRTLTDTIISMANGLGFQTVAEGIEDAEQLRLLRDLGCDVAQGFYLSRPIELSALERLMLTDCEVQYPRLRIGSALS